MACNSVICNKNKQHCCVPGCFSDGRYDDSVHFHHIPKDEDIRKQWIIKIRRDEGPLFKITNSTVVCSKHFKREDYKCWAPVKKFLKTGAIPSLFDWNEQPNTRRILKRKMPSETSQTPQSDNIITEETTMETEPNEAAADSEDSIKLRKLEKELATAKNQISNLKCKLIEKEKDMTCLRQQINIERFCVNRFSTDDSLILFYTGFQTYSLFLAFFECIQPSAKNMQSAYYKSSETISLSGRKRSMLLIDELFLFLCRLRAGLLEQDLSVRFSCSLPTISRKIITWANFLYFVLGQIPIWLSKDLIQTLMPDCFKVLYPRTRVVIDCTELKTQQPSSLVLNSQSYSSYKSSNTFKCLLGVAPHGAVTFISPLYTGCISDVELTKLSGLLDLLQPGDDVMADKGFTIRKLLNERGCTLNIPSFLSNKVQFTTSEIQKTEEIAKLRIHIERMNRRIKENHLFDSPIPINLSGTVNQLWTVACLLANFSGPLVKSWYR